ncbi:MAG: 5-methylcytosine restriction system component-like protein [Verrucomicrobiales bacterium]|nr:5-methylcytosine restriction system component-like protein [Verrucomicrobiales bacterium]
MNVGMIELWEYEPKLLPQQVMSREDAIRLRLNFRDQLRIERDFTNDDRWKIVCRGYVGFIPVNQVFTFSIRPKIGLANVFGMMDYAYQLDFRMMDGIANCSTLEEFYERLANILAKRVLLREKKGLYRSYVPQHDELSCVRGRIDIAHKIRKPWNVNIKCSFEEHTADVEENQILLWTLRGIAQTGLCSDRVMQTVRRAYRGLQGAASLRKFRYRQCVGRLYNRLNSDYEMSHLLCRFFLEQSGPLHLLGDHAIFPFLIDMARLFELFVAEWLRDHMPEGFELQIQANVTFSDANYLKFVIDLVICDSITGKIICVLDTKYKCPEAPQSDDVSQVVTYAVSKDCRNAVLIYPQQLNQQLDEKIGPIRVRNMAFEIDGDLEAAGYQFLDELNLTGLRDKSAA